MESDERFYFALPVKEQNSFLRTLSELETLTREIRAIGRDAVKEDEVYVPDVFFMTRGFLPSTIQHRSGTVIDIASLAGNNPSSAERNGLQ